MFEALVYAAVALQAYNFWAVGKGKMPYIGFMVVYSIYAVIEGWLATTPGQEVVALFVLLNIWAFVRSFRGWRLEKRLRKSWNDEIIMRGIDER